MCEPKTQFLRLFLSGLFFLITSGSLFLRIEVQFASTPHFEILLISFRSQIRCSTTLRVCLLNFLFCVFKISGVCVCVCVCVLVAQSCLTLRDPMDYSPPGSSIHGLLQARILEWVAIPFSRESFQPKDRTWVTPTAGRCFTIWANREAWCNSSSINTQGILY